MKTNKSIASDTLSMEWKVFNYAQDACEIAYTNLSASSVTVGDTFKVGSTDYTEDRYLPTQYAETRFDVREYVGQVDMDWKERLSLYGVGSLASWKTQLLSSVTEDGTTKALPMFFLNGSNVRNESMCASRLHLYNPHFPHIIEWMPVLSDGKMKVQMRWNYDEPSIYEYALSSTDKFPTAQLLLNKYTDDRYNEDGLFLYVTYPHHLEPSKEKEATYSDVDAVIADIDNIVASCTNTRTDAYIYDTRTKGAYLRFIDRFGFVQQILLNIQSRETAVTSADTIQTYQGKQMGYDNNVCEGNGLHANKTIKEVMHCGLKSINKELQGDILDLLVSPRVYLYRGGFNETTNDDSECQWEEVSVSASNLTISEKKQTFDCSIDVTTTSRNGYAV